MAGTVPGKQLGIGLIVGMLGLALGSGWWAKRQRTRDGEIGTGEHVPTDLLGDAPPAAGDRAPDAFRPDPTAAVPAGERDALRPATGGSPSIASPRGEVATQGAG